MHARVDVRTPFHIDVNWWEQHGRSLRRFLAVILDEAETELGPDTPMDYIDPQTAEVYELDPLWVRVLVTKARKPEYITETTPLAGAVLRALVENVNRPMSATDLYRRINRSNPETLLRVLRTARTVYGIVPVPEEA